MGRKPSRSKKSSFVLFLFKLVASMAVLTGVVYGVSYFVSKLSTLTFADLPLRSQALSKVVGVLAQKPGIPQVAGKSVRNNVSIRKSKVLEVAVLADSHNENDNLRLALGKAKEAGIKYVIYLGDYTSVGTVKELTDAKKVMDDSGLVYYSIPGDHDLWKSGDYSNFVSVFGERYQTLKINGISMILIDNSDNDQGIDNVQMSLLTDWLSKLDAKGTSFVFISNPLYNKTNFKLMGENNADVKKQAGLLLSLLRSSHVKAVLAGDNHLSFRSVDPGRGSLEHVVVGALAKDRNLQSPRFDILTVYDDRTYDINEVVL